MTLGHHHLYFPRLRISLAWRLVLSRLAAVGLSALVAGIAKGGIPQTLTGAALIVCGALVAVLLAAPDAFQAAGILRATAPDTVPLVQGLAQAVAKLNKTNMDGFAPAELGQKAPDGPSAAPEAKAAPMPVVGAETGISASTPAIATTDPALASDSAIATTGGNQ